MPGASVRRGGRARRRAGVVALAVLGLALAAVLVALALGAGRPISAGAGPAALVMTPAGQLLYAADTGTDSVTPVTLRK
jgi:hypothetical protein